MACYVALADHQSPATVINLETFYSAHGDTSELGKWSKLTELLPSDPLMLSKIVHGLIIHNGMVALKGLSYPPERHNDMKRSGAEDILDAIHSINDERLSSLRAESERMIGYCYHFALLYCALLRAKGIPARTRCGFASYYKPDYWIDHWVVERWHNGEWIITDANEGTDCLSEAQFRNAVTAWKLCRAGESDEQRYGNYAFWGWDELRGSLVNDLGALVKVELGDWDWCDVIHVPDNDKPLPGIDADLDDLAALASDDADFEPFSRQYFSDSRLRPV